MPSMINFCLYSILFLTSHYNNEKDKRNRFLFDLKCTSNEEIFHYIKNPIFIIFFDEKNYSF